MAYDISSWRSSGVPLSKEDLERRALRPLPEWARQVVISVSAERGVPVTEIFGKSRNRTVAAARHEAIYRVKATKPTVSSSQLGIWFGKRDHTTILNALFRFQKLTGAPEMTSRRLPERVAA